MKFTPKQKLINEAEANPLEALPVDFSYDEQYKQAILKAIASESSAHVEYDQILMIEPKVSQRSLVEHFHDTLVDIRDEEMKHIGQLTEKIRELPEFENAFDAGVEEARTGEEEQIQDANDMDDASNNKANSTVEKSDEKENSEENEEKKESKCLTEAVLDIVGNERLFDTEKVADVIYQTLGLNAFDYTYIEKLDEIFDSSAFKTMSADIIDECLIKLANVFQLSPEVISELENVIIQTPDPLVHNIQDKQADIQNDLNTLKNLLEDEKLYSGEVKWLLSEFISAMNSKTDFSQVRSLQDLF